VLYGGTFPDTSQFCNPTTGAFTFEALINVNTPFSTMDGEIVCGDNGGGITTRGWQWRIYHGQVEWDLLAGSTDNDFKANLPTTGPDAIANNAWYQIAITYTGYAPTNTDTANLITMYWTLVDGARTNADVIGQFTATRPLSGSSEGTSQPSIAIGGNHRSNAEGIIGSIDEVRISDVARAANAMAFTNNGQAFPVTFLQEPPATLLAPYNGVLNINCTVSASQPTYTWIQYTTNSTNVVANQKASTLSLSNITFATGGSYVLVVSNSINVVTSTVAQVTIGAAPTGLYSTGLDTNGNLSPGDVPDPHYTLIESQDSSFLGPNAMIFEWNNPLEFAPGSGSYSPSNGLSMWIGDQGNSGGIYLNSVPGNYTYRTTILLDQVNPATMTLTIPALSCNGTITNILLNGKSTGITVAPGAPLYFSAPISITNGFVPGLNTIDFVETTTGGGSAIRVDQPSAIGQALPPGIPTIVAQPTNQTVRDANQTGSGSVAQFSVVATGRPPLSYQWFADGNKLSGDTNRILDFYNPSQGAQGTNYSVVISNASGAITSGVVVLKIVSTNQPPVTPTLNLVSFAGQGATIEISDLLLLVDSDPDGDPLSFNYADGGSTNGGSVQQVNEGLVYTPASGYVGSDQFTYTVSDSSGASTVGDINLQNLLSPVPSPQIIIPGLTVSYSVGVTNPPFGYTFQWQLNGVSISGATNGLLVITNAQAANSGNYVLVVTDPSGVLWPSPPAKLVVEGYPPYQAPISYIIDSSEQSSFPAANAVDGDTTTFWVSYGTAAGQQPTAASPEWLFVTFPRPIALSEFLVTPRVGYGPNAVQMIVNSTLIPGTPLNGTETNGIPTNGTSVYSGSMANSATPLDVVLAKPVTVTNAELLVTTTYSAFNVQVAELSFNERSMPGTFGDWELRQFTAAQLNNPVMTSPFADPDGDGVVNLQEFAVGGNPLVKDATNAAMHAIVLPGNQVGITFQVTNNLGDISLQYQSSPDLVHWTNVTPTSVSVVTNRGTISIDEAVFPMQSPLLYYYRLNYGLTNVLRY